MKTKQLVAETITLSTPRGRLIFALTANIAIFASRYHWLSNLSLYQRLGLDWAPSIGLTRAYWKVLHGDLAGAWERNWLIFPVMTVLWCIVALDLYALVRGRGAARAARDS